MNEFEKYMEEYKSLTEKTKNLLFITRDINLQKSTIKELDNLIDTTLRWKDYAIDEKDENMANQQLAFEHILKALQSELTMWVNLKENKMAMAWDNLVDAQSYIRTAIQAHELANSSEDYAQRLLNIEKLVFPPQTFNSPGYLVKQAKCSICDKDYKNCNHIIGRPYMGEICCRIVEEAELLEISVVDVPADKKARMEKISDGKGNMIDLLTLKKLQEE